MNTNDKFQTRQLRQAINAGDYFQAKMLLERGVDPDATTRAGNTALHRAVIVGDGALVDLVLTYGPNLQARNRAWQTPGQLAEYLGDRETAVKLGYPVAGAQRSLGF